MVDLRLDGFFPALAVPIESAPVVTMAFVCLLLAIFTLTLRASLLVLNVRLALCAASSYYFWWFGYGFKAPTRLVESGMSIISIYGIYRNVETGLGYLLEPIPRWVVRGEEQKLPETFVWRIIWSLDLLFSLRGTSYVPHAHWTFVPPALIHPKHKKPRSTFIKDQIISLIGQFLFVDFFDTTIKARSWPTIPTSFHPITSLQPLGAQLYYAIVVCIMTALSISVPYTAVSTIAVMVGSSPASWPPMFDNPFHSTSLQSFWTHRWHASFRRVFLVISAAVLDLSNPFIVNARARAAFRGLCIFLLSCVMHLCLMYRVRPRTATVNDINFVEKETLLFFLLQPLGMLLEVAAVKPLSKRFLPEHVCAIHTYMGLGVVAVDRTLLERCVGPAWTLGTG